MKNINPEQFCGVWSAAPTPFDEAMEVDIAAIGRLTEHHVHLGVKGLFVAGSCGEGPWMTNSQRRTVLKSTVAAMQGRMPVAFQVSDNSSARILDNMRMAEEDGADLVVIAPPYTLRNATPGNLERLYMSAIENSPLPVIIYDLGRHASLLVEHETLESLYMAENVVAVKDSSSDPARRSIALAARKKRPVLRLLSGDEFHCDEYLEAGYDGLMLGGAAFNARLAYLIMEAVANGEMAQAHLLQERMNKIMYAVYGGEDISGWLAGFKKFLMEIGLFRTTENYLGYVLTENCQQCITEVLARDADVLLP